MGATTRGLRRVALPVVAVVAIGALLGACAPQAPSTPAEPGPPVISSFSAIVSRSEAPTVVVYRWSVSDPRNDILRCRLDVDGDGVFDHEIIPCRSSDTVMHSFDTPGARTATLEVSDGEFPPVDASRSIEVGPVTDEGYTIDLDLDPAMREDFKDAFHDAARRWETVITAGVPDVELDLPAGLFGWVPGYSGTVDDIRIAARAAYIDGPGQILGRAGAILVREPDFQPYFGIMEFDSADLDQLAANGRLHDVILHEMGHVIGLGTGWMFSGFIDNVLDPHYTAPAGVAAYQRLGGSRLVPLENDGQLGTLFGHWREVTFDDELMTGYLGATPTVMSVLTVAALADLGYGVDMSSAEPYVLPSKRLSDPDPAASQRGVARSVPLGSDGVGGAAHTEMVPPFLGGLPEVLPTDY